MYRSIFVVTAFAVASLACGGSNSGNGNSNGSQAPTVTVGSTVVKAGETGTLTAAIGDTLTIQASETVPGMTISHADGQNCALNYPDGLQTNLATYRIKIASGTTQCIIRVSFDEGDATLNINVS